jgi:hypothetical protein
MDAIPQTQVIMHHEFNSDLAPAAMPCHPLTLPIPAEPLAIRGWEGDLSERFYETLLALETWGKKVGREARRTAREGACAPQTGPGPVCSPVSVRFGRFGRSWFGLRSGLGYAILWAKWRKNRFGAVWSGLREGVRKADREAEGKG